jgi:hypothetical protein
VLSFDAGGEMFNASTLRANLANLADLVVDFACVALAFAVDNFREARNDRIVGEQYLSAFRQDLAADLKMLQGQQDNRQAQLKNARALLEFYDGRPSDPASFFQIVLAGAMGAEDDTQPKYHG